MRNSTFLPLIEQIMMIGIFAIASAICIGCFSLAKSISNETEYKDNAIILAQNTAETIKNHGGIHENKVIGYTDTLTETNMDTAEYFVKITPIENAIQLLGSAEIRIIHHNRTIYALTVCWQEEIAYEP